MNKSKHLHQFTLGQSGKDEVIEEKPCYIPDHWKIYTAKKTPKFYSASGYGSKIPTKYMVFDGRYDRRVYAICWSNAASYYVLVKGSRVFVPDYRF